MDQNSGMNQDAQTDAARDDRGLPEYQKNDGGRSAPSSNDRIRFKQAILASHQDAPQRAALVEIGLATIFDGVDMLAKLGHIIVVTEGETVGSGDEWPKMLYHPDAPEGRVFHEFDKPTGSGWVGTPIPRDDEGGDQLDVEGDSAAAARRAGPASRSASGFPKKLFHEHVPGGVTVQNADQEADFLGRGYSSDRPNRGAVNYGSHAQAVEDAPATALGVNPTPQAMRRGPALPKE